MANGNGFINTLTWRAVTCAGILLMFIIAGSYTFTGFVSTWARDDREKISNEAREARNTIKQERVAALREISDKIEGVADRSALEVQTIKKDILDIVDKNEQRQNRDMDEIKRLIRAGK